MTNRLARVTILVALSGCQDQLIHVDEDACAKCDEAADRRFHGAGWEDSGVVHLSSNAVLLNTGKVILWSSIAPSPAQWDPTTGTLTDFAYPTGPNFTDRNPIFNSGHISLPDGRILMVGGGFVHDTARTFDPAADLADPYGTLGDCDADLSCMATPRWYPTVVELGSGAILVASGDLNTPGQRSPAEIYDPPQDRWVPIPIVSLPGVFLPSVDIFPTMFLLPSGRIVLLPVADNNAGISGPALLSLDGPRTNVTLANGEVVQAPSTIDGWGPPFLPQLARRFDGAAVMLIDDTGATPTAKVMAVGDGPTSDLIDFTVETNPTVVADTLNFSRPGDHTGVVALPTGQVMVFDGNNAVPLPPEIFDDGRWSQADVAPRFARDHHGIAVLLPDGRVLLNSDGAGRTDETMEVYSPWYMTAERPTITSAPAAATHGATISVTTSFDPDRIVAASLIRPSSLTHGVDTGQRHIQLKVSRNGDSFDVTMPAANTAPPGDWLLHVIDDQGVPSPGRFLRVQLEEAQADPEVVQTATDTPIDIPDARKRGIRSAITVVDEGSVTSVDVDVDISHTWRGDLVVALACPDGTRVPLHQRTGGDLDDLVETYNVSACNGSPVNGRWVLEVSDREAEDLGTLNDWTVRIQRTGG